MSRARRETSGADVPTLEPAGDWLPVPDTEGASEVFRETFLVWVTEPALNGALRVLGSALHGMVLEQCRWPRLPGSLDYWDLLAVVGDLRHLQGVLERIAQEPDESEERARTTAGTALSDIAANEAGFVGEIAGRLERDLAGCRPAEPAL
jgi:hypothetical protein